MAGADDGPVEIADVLRAARHLEGKVRRTPLERSEALSEFVGVEVWLKLEGMQRTGSFKVRGALNAVASLSTEERARGLVTASAGNHGLGVAFAAREMGARATVFVPETAAETKTRRIGRLGAELVRVAGTYDDAHARAEAHAAKSGGVFVHAYSAAPVVAGQGTVGLEIARELPEARAVIAPVGGGGLIGGIGVAARALLPGGRVVGVQTEATSAMHASLAAGELVLPPMGETICEGLSGETDERAFTLVRRVVDEVVLVSEAAARRAVRWLFVEEGVVAEGSAAVGVAALLEGAVRPAEGPVAVVVTGSNVDAARLAEILAS